MKITKIKPVEERFWSKVLKTEACWVWTGAKSKLGYGSFMVYKHNHVQKNIMAYRFSYESAKGKIPEGLDIDHLCRNPACVNPDHLEAVTRKVNIQRGKTSALKHLRKPSVRNKRTLCKQGHKLEDDNVYIIYREDRGRTERSCKACNRIYARERYRRIHNVTKLKPKKGSKNGTT